MFVSTAYAQTAAPAAGGADMIVQFLPLILIFIVFYFLLIRPQQKKMKEHKSMLEAIRRGAKLDFDGCMVQELRLSLAFLAGHDFYEGIRAALVDKDRNPRWSPATLAEVSPSEVERHFAVPAGGDLAFSE